MTASDRGSSKAEISFMWVGRMSFDAAKLSLYLPGRGRASPDYAGSGLMHELTAVNIHGLTGDELGPIRSQKHHRTDQIFRLLLALDGASRDP